MRLRLAAIRQSFRLAILLSVISVFGGAVHSGLHHSSHVAFSTLTIQNSQQVGDAVFDSNNNDSNDNDTDCELCVFSNHLSWEQQNQTQPPTVEHTNRCTVTPSTELRILLFLAYFSTAPPLALQS